MSVIKFELKAEHVKLLKHLRWSMMANNFIVSCESIDEGWNSFGTDNFYETIDLILNGKPDDFDPLNTDEPTKYSNEQIAEWDKLYAELPTALDVIMHNGNFDLGQYKTRYHDRNWKKLQA